MNKLKKCTNLNGTYFLKRRVLQFPEKEGLISDEDIKELFLGLIELVKRNIEIKTQKKYERTILYLKKEIESYKNNN